jgi:hypothetical protein
LQAGEKRLARRHENLRAMPRFRPVFAIRPVPHRAQFRLFPKACMAPLLMPVRFCNFCAQAYTGDYKK